MLIIGILEMAAGAALMIGSVVIAIKTIFF